MKGKYPKKGEEDGEKKSSTHHDAFAYAGRFGHLCRWSRKAQYYYLGLGRSGQFRTSMIGVSIRQNRYSHACVKRTKEFVVNLPTEEMVRKVDACGVLSGRDSDKFASMGWNPIPAEKVKPPLIEECFVQMECQVKEVLSLGSHDLFVGEVVALHVNEEILKEKGRIDITKALPIAFCPGANEYWSLGKSIGHYGFTKGKP